MKPSYATDYWYVVVKYSPAGSLKELYISKITRKTLNMPIMITEPNKIGSEINEK